MVLAIGFNLEQRSQKNSITPNVITDFYPVPNAWLNA